MSKAHDPHHPQKLHIFAITGPRSFNCSLLQHVRIRSWWALLLDTGVAGYQYIGIFQYSLLQRNITHIFHPRKLTWISKIFAFFPKVTPFFIWPFFGIYECEISGKQKNFPPKKKMPTMIRCHKKWSCKWRYAKVKVQKSAKLTQLLDCVYPIS